VNGKAGGGSSERLVSMSATSTNCSFTCFWHLIGENHSAFSPRLLRDNEQGEVSVMTYAASGISCHGGTMKTGMQPERTASVSRLLDAVSPGGIRQNLLRCMLASSSLYGICATQDCLHLFAAGCMFNICLPLERIASVSRLLDAVSPGGIRRNLLRCMFASIS